MLLPLIAGAAESTVWDLDNNVVTYSDTVSGIALNTGTTLDLSQFNSVNVANAEGVGNSSEYTLTKVVLTIDGSLSGLVEFENETASSAASVTVYLSDGPMTPGWSEVSFDGASATENYTAQQTFSNVAADDDVAPDWAGADYGAYNVDCDGTGAGSSGDLTSDLTAYIGDGTITTDVDFHGTFTAAGLPSGSQTITDVYGDAAVSVAYYYDYTPVPEPTSVAFLSLCVMFLAMRRRLNRENK